MTISAKLRGPAGRTAVIGFLLVLATTPLHAAPAPGNLDRSFGGDGKVLTELPGDTSGYDTALMRDGRILLVGRKDFDRILLIRYRPNGALDRSFSGNGWLVTDAMESPEIPKVIIGRRGVIFVVASSNEDFAVMKLSGSGALKTGYGAGGVRTVDFGGMDNFETVAPGPRGKFYAAGSSFDGQANAAIARFNASGTLDTNSDSDPGSHWGVDGKVVVDEGGHIRGLKSLRNGKVMVGSIQEDISLSRFTRRGVPDTTYHGTGQVMFEIGDDLDHIGKMTFAPGVMYVGALVGTERDIRVGRFRLSGSPDNSFDEDGLKTFDLAIDDVVTTIREGADGKPVLVGSSEQNEPFNRLLIMRLRRNGTRDSSFGNNGVVFTRFHSDAEKEDSIAQDLDIQADGRLLVSGESILNELRFDSIIARYHSGTCGKIGTNGNDTLRGSPANDYICGLRGVDKIRGLGGRDRLVGGPGPDLLVGGPGVDVCIGGPGGDTLRGCEN